MDLHDSPDEARFRRDARNWLEANLPAGWGTADFEAPENADEEVAFLKQWQRTLFDGGWAGLDWPEEYGGRDIGVMESMIWAEEYTRVRGPNQISMSVGTSLVGPTLIAAGAEWQKERYLAPILKGEEVWCQGFSEPNAGSDLASLKCRGTVVGDELVVNGQKTWTSFAHQADWCILVVRTNPEAVRHKGLTFVLCDMKSPGITIRPLIEMTGHAWFNEVFFDDVKIPRQNVVGELDRGWDIVMTTLSVERGSSSQHARLTADLDWLFDLARRTQREGRSAAQDPIVRQQLAGFAAEVMVMKMSGMRNAGELQKNGVPGPEGSILKVVWSELDQRVKEAAIELLGPAGLVPKGDPHTIDDGYWAYELLWSRAASIYAGTSEVQRNIIANRVLGLPR
ncbi:MAG: acyl-CoA dehydrogenase family protein [Deltaproteobacteria bacterium]|nr:acyl-CoA dehydrogenase family protein [Deltaproteobacteria bacterium]MBW2388795.1 acyl-CoA dehydrogenase family protein [Deltaproteobacteria bacterium]MBW2724123.1 acyl-CoA dehydrogenase family protein [Deltaproteobacteria bacterium]